MKTITLKLTKTEIDSIWGSTNSKTLEFFHLMECYDKNETFTHHECEIFDVDKFREFLNDEIHSLEMKSRDEYGHSDNLNDLKSILSKLDKAVVQNDEPKDFEGHCPECGCDDLDGGFNGDGDQELECSKGHKFTIQCKGWEIV